MFIDVVITIILIILSLFFKKSKSLSILNFLFMWSLWGWNSWNGDYDNYQYRFENITTIWDVGDYEIGYDLINILFNSLQVDFQSFLIIFSFITLIIIAVFCLKYSKFPALFSALYFVIFIMEYVFIRNFLVHSILFLAFLLVFEEVKHFKFWYVFLVLLAASFHSTAYIFLVFFLSFITDEIIDLKKAVFFTLILVLISIFSFEVLIQLLGTSYIDKVDFYSTGGGITTSFYAHFLIVLLTYLYVKVILEHGEEVSSYQQRIFTIFVNVNILSLTFLSVYYHIPYFSRALRFLFAFNILFLLNGFAYVRILKYRLLMFAIFMMIFSAVIVMFLKSTLSLTLYPLYLCNYLWGDEIYVPDFDF
jgi:hypothetical protein